MSAREQALPAPALAGLAGLGSGLLLVFAAGLASPFPAVLALGGALGALAVLLVPAWGFLLTAAVIPLERLGRFTDDASMYTFSLMRVAGVLALGSCLVHALARKWKLHFGPEIALYAGYAGLAVAMIFFTTDMRGAVRAGGAILGNLTFFFLVTNLARRWSLVKTAVLLWLAVSVVMGIYTAYDWHFGQEALEESRIGSTEERLRTVWQDASEWESLEHVRRAMGPTSHAAVYGINLILTLPFFFFLFRSDSSPWVKRLAALGLPVVLYNVLLSNTRAAILLAALVTLVCVLRGMVTFRAAWVLPLVLLGSVMPFFVPSDVYQRVLDPSNYTYGRSSTLRIRMEYWKAGLEVVEKHWLVGVGAGNENEIPKYVKGHGPAQTTVHNEYLQTLLEVGILGWACFFSFVALVFRRALQAGALFRGREEEKYWFSVAAQVAMVAVLLYGVQVDVFHFPLKGWWLIAGIVSVMPRFAPRAAGPVVAGAGGGR